MQAPPIDRRSHEDLVAWTETLARCPRALPGTGLVGAVLDADVLDPADGTTVIAAAGTLVDDELATAIAARPWLDVEALLLGGMVAAPVEDPVTRQVHPVGTVVDPALAALFAGQAQLFGAKVLVDRVAFGDWLTDPLDEDRTWGPGRPVDADMAFVVDRLAWVRVRSWQPDAEGRIDPGGALIRIAGRFAELVVERINRAAEKHELAFLDLIGTEPLPPRPARVPLTFTLAESSPVDVLVPAGTQVAAPPLEGEEGEVVFETERSLVVTRAALAAAFVSDTEADTYSDRSRQANGEVDEPFAPFTATEPMPHELYVACDELLTRPGTKAVKLMLKGDDSTGPLAAWPITWSGWDGKAWRDLAATSTLWGTPTGPAAIAIMGAAAIGGLAPSPLVTGDSNPLVPNPLASGLPRAPVPVPDAPGPGMVQLPIPTVGPVVPTGPGLGPGALPLTWQVSLPEVPELVPTEVGGHEAAWLRARLDMPLQPGRTGLAPESVASGTKQPQDLELPFAPFGDTTPAKFFYLSVDEAVGGGGGAAVRLHVDLQRAGVGPGVRLNWTYRAGDDWQPLVTSALPGLVVVFPSITFVDYTQGFTRSGDVAFQVPDNWPATRYRNRMGRWLRVEIDDAGGSYTTLPVIGGLTASYGWSAPPSIERIAVRVASPPVAQPPPLGAVNGSPLDLTKELHPFGEEPAFNDTLHLALPEALARPRAQLRLGVVLANPVGNGVLPDVWSGAKPTLTWEVWDGRTWSVVNATDSTGKLTASGEVALELPGTLGVTEVAGQEAHWLRVRLTGGNYGRAADYTTVTDKATGAVTYVPVRATFAPPIVKSLSFTPVRGPYEDAPASACLTHNDLTYTDRTPSTPSGGPLFAPFSPRLDREPALYLGFDRAFDPQPTTLYLQVEPPAPEDVAADSLIELDPDTWAEVAWEYSGPGGAWLPLGAVDETGALASRGVVTFPGPRDLTRRVQFGRDLCWLRARWPRGYFRIPPLLRRVWLNTTWALQVAMIDGEVLGSGNGNADQVFATAQTPVQPGSRLVVREPELPPATELAALRAAEGDDVVTVVPDEAGQPDEIWVRWHQVPDFHESGPRDRHYRLDPSTGEVRFGDGRYGLAPPLGQANVRISYATGGGAQGNRPAGTLVQLRSGLPYLDSVTNHEPAEGGAAGEPIDRLRARGPRALRHRDRVVTAQDLEDLANEASADVARTLAIGPAFEPVDLWLESSRARPAARHGTVDAGRMGVVVVPDSDVARPTPSLGLLAEVDAYLQDRCPPTADLWVAGPEWVRVTVTAVVAPTSLETANTVAARVAAALERFLHPLTGGPLGRGWAFGRKPHRSDLFAVVEAVDEVDHVASMAVDHDPETADPRRRAELRAVLERALAAQRAGDPPVPLDQRRWLARALVYSGPHQISVELGP